MFSAAARVWLARTCSVTLSIAIAVLSMPQDEVEIAVCVDRPGEAGRNADRRILLGDHRRAVQAMAVPKRFPKVERQVPRLAVIPDIDMLLRHRLTDDPRLLGEFGKRGDAGDHQAEIDDLDLRRLVAEIVDERVLAMECGEQCADIARCHPAILDRRLDLEGLA